MFLETVSHETPASDVEAQKTFVKGEFLPTDYTRVGKFVNGLADYAIPATIGKVSELLIRVNDHTGQNWVIISEVWLFTAGYCLYKHINSKTWVQKYCKMQKM